MQPMQPMQTALAPPRLSRSRALALRRIGGVRSAAPPRLAALDFAARIGHAWRPIAAVYRHFFPRAWAADPLARVALPALDEIEQGVVRLCHLIEHANLFPVRDELPLWWCADRDDADEVALTLGQIPVVYGHAYNPDEECAQEPAELFLLALVYGDDGLARAAVDAADEIDAWLRDRVAALLAESETAGPHLLAELRSVVGVPHGDPLAYVGALADYLGRSTGNLYLDCDPGCDEMDPEPPSWSVANVTYLARTWREAGAFMARADAAFAAITEPDGYARLVTLCEDVLDRGGETPTLPLPF